MLRGVARRTLKSFVAIVIVTGIVSDGLNGFDEAVDFVKPTSIGVIGDEAKKLICVTPLQHVVTVRTRWY